MNFMLMKLLLPIVTIVYVYVHIAVTILFTSLGSAFSVQYHGHVVFIGLVTGRTINPAPIRQQNKGLIAQSILVFEMIETH